MAYMTWSGFCSVLRCNVSTKEGAEHQRLAETVRRPWPGRDWRMVVEVVVEGVWEEEVEVVEVKVVEVSLAVSC